MASQNYPYRRTQDSMLLFYLCFQPYPSPGSRTQTLFAFLWVTLAGMCFLNVVVNFAFSFFSVFSFFLLPQYFRSKTKLVSSQYHPDWNSCRHCLKSVTHMELLKVSKMKFFGEPYKKSE